MREHTDGDFPFANDFNAVVRDALASATLVRSGCTVDDGGSNVLIASIASGVVFVDGNEIAVGSQTVTLDESDSTDDRYDLVVVDGTGSAQKVTGTAASTPKAPTIPPSTVLLAIIEVPAGATDMTHAEIYDARVVIDEVPNAVVTQGDGSGLDADTVDGYDTPLPNDSLSNVTITVNTGANMSGGGTVALGESVTIEANTQVPSGIIALWSGSISNVPTGWILCDGNNGTPNLQDRFVVGAGSNYSVGDTGGSATHTLTESELPSHVHDYVDTDISILGSEEVANGSDRGDYGRDRTTDSVGGDSAHENRPPYYAIAYIMRT